MLRAEGIAKTFFKGGANEVRALNGVNLRLDEGEFVTVIGSNGAGKSTFLNAVAGVFPVDEGRVVIGDTDVTAWPEWRRAVLIGRVFQDPSQGTCPGATIEQNLALALKRGQPRGLGPGVRRRDRELFRERLSRLGLGLENRLRDPAGLLSGGQRQALTMLMSVLVRPRLLLLDEHTAALDPKTAEKILGLTARLVEELGLSTLMVTHNMRQAIGLGHRLVMFHRGEIVLDIRGEEKRNLRVENLLTRFAEARGEEFTSDRALLV
ncbi:MAG TPA: ATP-binding cassette domain-containing protein [Desulfovibrio sp.]|jgi:putative ABC transport system ATP-binding protein|uniref:ABC transporter ATP-binding protein n=1 Tax=Desulfovibrio TaxID=872 RepID=UPI0003F76791|nr:MULTISPECIES: ATP-binding cassette domain-containing protein [Desulfovibrio]MDY0307017.1 ATP-binding cassette domain-containing protein [Desulfovibrionaceae bacterium]HMM38141.1 ATP-binding cassette domain-containing protein [Desulfovibrio sp.]